MFDDAIREMQCLVRNINLSADVEKEVCGNLEDWKNKGISLSYLHDVLYLILGVFKLHVSIFFLIYIVVLNAASVFEYHWILSIKTRSVKILYSIRLKKYGFKMYPTSLFHSAQ